MDQQDKIVQEEKNSLGSIRVADEVVRIIAGLAATEVSGVCGMSGGVVGGIAELLGHKNLSKGVKVEVGEKETAIDLSIIVDYGSRIPDVAANIQNTVKTTIEKMTGLKVVEVNVNVQGVAFASDNCEEDTRVK